MSNRAWEQDALNYLRESAATQTFDQIIEQFNAVARSNNWLERSHFAISSKLWGMGFSRRKPPTGIATRALARQLGIRTERIAKWRRHGLKFHIKGLTHLYTLADFKQFCWDNPHLLAQVKPDLLLAVVQDEALVKRITETVGVYERGSRRAVQRLDTGEVYPSLRSAAKALYVADWRSVSDAIRDGVPCQGVIFRFVTPSTTDRYPKRTRICEVCNSEFSPKRYKSKRRTCSNQCKHELDEITKARKKLQQAEGNAIAIPVHVEKKEVAVCQHS